MEVTWEDQQNINTFSRLNNRFHDLHDEIKSAKVLPLLSTHLLILIWVSASILGFSNQIRF